MKPKKRNLERTAEVCQAIIDQDGRRLFDFLADTIRRFFEKLEDGTLSAEERIAAPGAVLIELTRTGSAACASFVLREGGAVETLQSHSEIATVFGVRPSTVKTAWASELPKDRAGTYPTAELVEFVYRKRHPDTVGRWEKICC